MDYQVDGYVMDGIVYVNGAFTFLEHLVDWISPTELNLSGRLYVGWREVVCIREGFTDLMHLMDRVCQLFAFILDTH